jgi:hypothetical protein
MRNQRIEKLKNILQKKTIDRSIMRRSLVSYRYIIINYKKKKYLFESKVQTSGKLDNKSINGIKNDFVLL